MKYKKLENKIIIEDLSQFNINQIFDCGQIFRYYICNNIAEVVSLDKYARIFTHDYVVEIETNDIDYFEYFFDLKNDYSRIKNKLVDDEFLAPAVEFGYGIRILNQNLFEMIVSFIISANNNIKRIKNSLNYLSKKFGTKIQINLDKGFDTKNSKNLSKMDVKCGENKNFYINNNFSNIINTPLSRVGDNRIEYCAFPTLEQLKNATVEDFVEAGLGYRAEYMYNTIQRLTQKDLDDFNNLSKDEKLNFLLSLKGIGEKVAHCILLFACHDTTRFPVDTWINKVYNDLTNTISANRKAISKELTNRYGDLSGYAQQYFFYYYRENK